MDADILLLFCDVDDFCQCLEPEFKKHLLADGPLSRIRSSSMRLSEVMTITIYFHLSGYRTFKDFYTRYVTKHSRSAFPQLVSYNRLAELMAEAAVPMCAYLRPKLGRCLAGAPASLLLTLYLWPSVITAGFIPTESSQD